MANLVDTAVNILPREATNRHLSAVVDKYPRAVLRYASNKVSEYELRQRYNMGEDIDFDNITNLLEELTNYINSVEKPPEGGFRGNNGIVTACLTEIEALNQPIIEVQNTNVQAITDFLNFSGEQLHPLHTYLETIQNLINLLSTDTEEAIQEQDRATNEADGIKNKADIFEFVSTVMEKISFAVALVTSLVEAFEENTTVGVLIVVVPLLVLIFSELFKFGVIIIFQRRVHKPITRVKGKVKS